MLLRGVSCLRDCWAMKVESVWGEMGRKGEEHECRDEVRERKVCWGWMLGLSGGEGENLETIRRSWFSRFEMVWCEFA